MPKAARYYSTVHCASGITLPWPIFVCAYSNNPTLESNVASGMIVMIIVQLPDNDDRYVGLYPPTMTIYSVYQPTMSLFINCVDQP